MMKMKDKIKNYFFLDEEYEEEIVTQPTSQVKQMKQQPVQQQSVGQPSRFGKVPKERKLAPVPVEPLPQQNNVVNLQLAASSKSSKVVLVEPRVYAEAQDIAEHLNSKRATIVNLQRIDREQGIRIIDFLSGTIYALGGDIQRVGKDIFLCTPDNVEVSGEISSYLTDDI